MNESILIDIENGNVNIESECSQDSLMSATTVLTASMVLNSKNSLDEIIEIIKQGANAVIENDKLSVNEESE